MTTDAELEALVLAIKNFESALPGWWWSVCHCQLTRDASCAPDFRVFGLDHPHVVAFDNGFHEDSLGSLADALNSVRLQALEAIKEMEK